MLATIILLFAQCKSDNKSTLNTDCYKEVSLNPGGDTNFVTLHYSNIRFLIHYFKNKPQGILVQNDNQQDSLASHFANDNKGVFIAISPELGTINFMGYKYLKGDGGADIAIDSLGHAKSFTSWTQYGNNGRLYDMNQVNTGQINVYNIKDGEKVDSLMYLRK